MLGLRISARVCAVSQFTQGKIRSLDDKLKLVGHCRMFDKLQLVDVVKRLLW
jgi:hypothetical protein